LEVMVQRIGRPICFALDGDRWEDAEMWAQELQLRASPHRGRAGFLHLLPDEDPDEIPHEQLMARARESVR